MQNLGISSPNKYATDVSIANIFGFYNMNVWSQQDPTQPQGAPNTATIQTALNYADAYIVDYFREQGNYATPLSGNSASAAVLTTDWCSKLAGIWLYENRGARDTAEDNKYETMKARVYEQMAFHVSAKKLDSPKRWPAPTGPVGV